MLDQILLYKELSSWSLITMAFLVAGSIIIYNNRTVERGSRRTFLDIIFSLMLIVVLDWIAYVTSGLFPDLQLIHAVLMAIMFSLAPAIPVSIGIVISPQAHPRAMIVMLVINAVLQFASIFGGFIFWIDDANVYHRGSFYFLYMISYTLSSLYLVVQSVRVGQIYQSASPAAVIAILGCLIIGVVIQVFDTTIRTTWPAVAMTVVLYFVFYSDMILRSDPLTKLLNRRSFDGYMEKPDLPCDVVVVDVDDFKHVNDTYGHAYGDECLVRIASLLRKAFGASGLCYRTGGDEFVVIVNKQQAPLDTTIANLEKLVERAQAEDDKLPGVSVGWAHADKSCTDLVKVTKAADQNMYGSKRVKKA